MYDGIYDGIYDVAPCTTVVVLVAAQKKISQHTLRRLTREAICRIPHKEAVCAPASAVTRWPLESPSAVVLAKPPLRDTQIAGSG
jgi:hypothetical protein